MKYSIETPGKHYSKEIYAKTKKYQKVFNFEIGEGVHDTWNNEADAFKHTFASADMAIKLGSSVSKGVCDFHEFRPAKNPANEKNMDKWNNYQGRIIAQAIKTKYSPLERIELIKSGKMDDIIADMVMRKMKNGELITNPEKDNRRFPEKDLREKLFDLKNRVFYKGELLLKDLNDRDIRDVFLDQALDKEGIPIKEELNKKVLSGELIYVENYTRADGTKVSGYYRALPKS